MTALLITDSEIAQYYNSKKQNQNSKTKYSYFLDKLE